MMIHDKFVYWIGGLVVLIWMIIGIFNTYENLWMITFVLISAIVCWLNVMFWNRPK